MRVNSQQADPAGAGGTADGRSALAVSEGARIRPDRARFCAPIAAVAVLLCAGIATAQTAPGTQIVNVATVGYGGNDPGTESSNPVVTVVAPLPTSSVLEIQRAVPPGGGATSTTGPTHCEGAGGFAPLPPPMLPDGAIVNPLAQTPLASTGLLQGGEPAFLRLVDGDRNLDAAAIDVVELEVTTPAGDRERLRLSENGPDTGVFVGYVQTRIGVPAPGNCQLEVERNGSIDARYVDPLDPADASSDSALIDAWAVVFDSRSGARLNGVRVRLLDAATGAPATVTGDDGVSSYPSEMVTGTSVIDSGGTVYNLPDGVYRFPVVTPGDYRLEIMPPPGYAFPSALSLPELALTPGGPYRLNGGSFGLDFTVSAPGGAATDVPLDVIFSELFTQKSTTATVAAVGDFVPYQLTVENLSATAPVAALQTVDMLPAGLRYRPGSTRVDGAAAPDPQLSADGRTLTFLTGSLAPGARVTIRYVAEVTAGARGPQLSNEARAYGPAGDGSNVARATIQLREELFRERAVLAGRVYEGGCEDEGAGRTGVAGVRVYLEDGRYATTDVEGKYHFDDLRPGSHVVQLDTLTLPPSHEALDCPLQVRHAGRAWSQFVDLRGGALWRADFRLTRRPLPAGTVSLRMETAQTGEREFAHWLAVRVEDLGIRDARLLVMLPEGLEYRPGSAEIEGVAVPEPSQTAGVLSLRLGALPAGSGREIRFGTRAAEGASGALPVRAVVNFATPSAPTQSTAPIENLIRREAAVRERGNYRFTPRFEVLGTEIQPADRRELDRIVAEWRGAAELRLEVVGHTDRTPIAPRSRVRFADNYTLSQARAEAVAAYLLARLPLDPAQVTTSGRGPDQPIAAGRDAASLAVNRRVEIAIEGSKLVADARLELAEAEATSPSLATQGSFDLPESAAAVVAAAPGRGQPPYPEPGTLVPGIDWVLPADGDVPAIPSIKVAVRHGPVDRVELSVNGRVPHELNFDGVVHNEARTLGMSRWRGIDLRDGDNHLVAVIRDVGGSELQRLERRVHYAGGAVRAELVREASRLVADGRTRPVIALRMSDAHGRAARPGTQGTFRVEAPHRSWWEVAALNENKLVAVGERKPVFSVGEDGIARLELEPTSLAGAAVVRLRFNERHEQEVRAWLEPEARDWILVGLAEGTAAWNEVSGRMEPAAAAGIEDGYASDGRIAFFAKGAIRGEYLLTLAFDSERDRDQEKSRLLGVVEPDRYYTLYGDATEQRHEAASAGKLYLRLERRQFAALFGDYETGLTVTELSRYRRTLNGLRAEWAGERYGYTAFAAESDQGFVRDELPGDGTSGLYRLSRQPLIVNSDRVRIEVRDRFHSERVFDTQSLARHLDYDVDYLAGTLYFKRPVPARDAEFNPVWIVAEYEVTDGGRREITAGGRAALRLDGDRLEAGASFINEGAATGDTRIAGLDLRWRAGEATRVRAEVARSDSDDPARPADASAYLAVVEHVSGAIDLRAYLREQDSGFGTGQQSAGESGTRKFGADGRYRVSDRLLVEAELYRQTVLQTGAERDHASAALRYEAADHALGAGLRHVSDSGLAGAATESTLGFLSGRLDLFDDRVSLRASQDVPLGSRDGSPDFPVRSLIGIDYHLRADSTLFAEYEHAAGENIDADMTRIGMRTAPWERAQLQSSVTHQAGEYGPRVFANLGLTHRWQLGERWGIDSGIDQSRTIEGAALEPLNPAVPLASGSLDGDYVAGFVGTMYRGPLWTFTSRLESRQADAEDRVGLSAGFYREPASGRAFTAGIRLLHGDFADGRRTREAELQLSWARRPVESRWILLDRLELKRAALDETAGRQVSSRIVNNLNANWQMDAATQLGLQLGTRYVESTFDGLRYDGLSVLAGGDLRRDLGARFDLGFQGATLRSLESGVSDHSAGVDLGVTFMRNVWVSLGYNLVGFRDQDFSAGRYTARGPYLRFRIKADQDTLRDLGK